MKDSEIIKKAEELMGKLLELLVVQAEVKVSMEVDEAEKKYLKVHIEAENLGYLIGYRGKTLNSLQSIFGQMLSGEIKQEEMITVNIDVNDYRERRKTYLESLALRAATEAKESGQSVELPPLSSYERRVIHMVLKEEDGVLTESEGEGVDRHIVIKLGERTEKE